MQDGPLMRSCCFQPILGRRLEFHGDEAQPELEAAREGFRQALQSRTQGLALFQEARGEEG